MIDFHTHSLLSDGVLLPSELVRRAKVIGYHAIAITDHADESNMESVLSQIVGFCRQNNGSDIKVVPGVELTHIPPRLIPRMVEKARTLGAKVVVGHGETLVEPVAPGTNMAYIKARVDVLAHPGLINEEGCKLGVRNSVHFEITSRSGHSLSNGHVAAMAVKYGLKLLINTDSHGPGDLINDDTASKVVFGTGLHKMDLRRIRNNAEKLLEKVL